MAKQGRSPFLQQLRLSSPKSLSRTVRTPGLFSSSSNTEITPTASLAGSVFCPTPPIPHRKGLLDQRLTELFPSQVLSDAVDLTSTVGFGFRVDQLL